MEHLPVEVIGNILSRLGGARDVVIASATCRKWREAWCKHLHTLSFNSNDWHVYHDLTTSQLEILITQTIFQTTGLQGLLILMDGVDKFSASTVIAWLMYTRETLRRLIYNVRTTPNVNILEICGRQKMEMLELSHNSITGVEPNFQRFPCLKSLSLSDVSISALDLNLCSLLAQRLRPWNLSTQNCNHSNIRRVYVEAISMDKFILEADSIECLHLKDCALELFELIGKGTLKHFKIDDQLHYYMAKVLPNDLQIIKADKTSSLGCGFDDEDEIVDLETIAVCFPQLSHLALSYDLRDGVVNYGLQGSSHLENVIVLELGWTIINDLFSHWVEGLLKLCPNLRKLVIHGVVSEAKSHEECQILANFTSSIVQLMRKYMHVDVQFDYE
ncbi:F-box/LRR-repeat protein [Salix suchowensis]|nr:F-box/LRR-repeat protein [Salix suchowensis]